MVKHAAAHFGCVFCCAFFFFFSTYFSGSRDFYHTCPNSNLWKVIVLEKYVKTEVQKKQCIGKIWTNCWNLKLSSWKTLMLWIPLHSGTANSLDRENWMLVISTVQGGLNKKEIQLNLCNVFSIFIFNDLYLFCNDS